MNPRPPDYEACALPLCYNREEMLVENRHTLLHGLNLPKIFAFIGLDPSLNRNLRNFEAKKSSFSTFRRQEKRILRKEKNRKGLINGFSEGWSHLDVDKSIRFVLIESHRFLLIVETGAVTSRPPRLSPERQIGWE